MHSTGDILQYWADFMAAQDLTVRTIEERVRFIYHVETNAGPILEVTRYDLIRYLGLDPDSKKEADLNKAGELLRKIRPYIQKFHSSEYINALANGDICLAVGYSGDILQAKKRAEEAKNGVQIGYSIPKEGALMWFDSFVVPKDAANVDAALKFIDFVNKPEMAAKNSDFIQYANGNIASKPLLSAALRDNPGVYPPDEVMGRLYTITPYDQKSQRLVNRLWTRIKTGK